MEGLRSRQRRNFIVAPRGCSTTHPVGKDEIGDLSYMSIKATRNYSDGEKKMKRIGTVITGLVLILFAMGRGQARSEVKAATGGGFGIEQELMLAASPEEVFDAATGDISAWWDHSFSGHPKKLYIEPKPGGGFYEIFDDAGNGVLHATVIYAQRGKMLRFVGPLGLSGKAIDCVTTWEFSPLAATDAGAGGAAAPAGTRLKLTVEISGEVDEATAKIVDAVWHHFLGERLKGYIESGEYKKKRVAIAGGGLDPADRNLTDGVQETHFSTDGKLSDFTWLTGRWMGALGTGTAEETCSDASRGVMTCMIRYVESGKVTELEFVSLREVPRFPVSGLPVQEGGVVKAEAAATTIEERVRFFLADLSEKPGDNGLALRLGRLSAGEIVFDNVATDGAVKHLRFIRNGTDDFTTRLEVVGADGKPGALEAKWKRVK